MVQAKSHTDRAVADIILNNDSDEDFGSDNNNELSESESEYKSQSDSDAEDKLPMHSVDETAASKNKSYKNESGTPCVHLNTNQQTNLFMSFLA